MARSSSTGASRTGLEWRSTSELLQPPPPPELDSSSRAVENAGERLQVARIAGLVAEQPVFRTPEEVGEERIACDRPAYSRVIIADQPLRRAAGRCTSFRAWRNGRCLPWLRLSFRDHQPLASSSDGPENSFAGRAGRAALGAVEIERSMAETAQRRARVIVDAHDVGQRSGNRDRVPLVACAPPLRDPND